jgi:hypothetical protein
MKWESLKWAYFERDDFVIGPMGRGSIQNSNHRKIFMKSNTIDNNSIFHDSAQKNCGDWLVKSSTRVFVLISF